MMACKARCGDALWRATADRPAALCFTSNAAARVPPWRIGFVCFGGAVLHHPHYAANHAAHEPPATHREAALHSGVTSGASSLMSLMS